MCAFLEHEYESYLNVSSADSKKTFDDIIKLFMRMKVYFRSVRILKEPRLFRTPNQKANFQKP